MSTGDRTLKGRKVDLFDKYRDLLESSAIAFFFRHKNLTTSELDTLRNDLKAIPTDAPLRLTVLRTNLLPPVLRALPNLPSDLLAQEVKGSLAVFTSPELHPPTLKAYLRVFNQHAKRLNVPAKPATKTLPASLPIQKLDLLSSVVEQRRELTAEQSKAVADLPDLKGLQSQIVGLLQGAPSQLVAVLVRGGGGQVVSLLESHRLSLEEAAKVSTGEQTTV